MFRFSMCIMFVAVFIVLLITWFTWLDHKTRDYEVEQFLSDMREMITEQEADKIIYACVFQNEGKMQGYLMQRGNQKSDIDFMATCERKGK